MTSILANNLNFNLRCTSDSATVEKPLIKKIKDITCKTIFNLPMLKKTAIIDEPKYKRAAKKILKKIVRVKPVRICDSFNFGRWIKAGPTPIIEKTVVNVITTVAAFTIPKSDGDSNLAKTIITTNCNIACEPFPENIQNRPFKVLSVNDEFLWVTIIHTFIQKSYFSYYINCKQTKYCL